MLDFIEVTRFRFAVWLMNFRPCWGLSIMLMTDDERDMVKAKFKEVMRR